MYRSSVAYSIVRRFMRVFASTVLLLIVVVVVFGQSSTSLDGTVTDPNGAAVVGATVTLKSLSTGLTRTATSDVDGHFQFSQLAPGPYRLQVEQPGFKTVELPRVQLLVNTPTTQNVQFTEVGGVGEMVTIVDEVSINKVDATIGNAINETQIRQLPLEGRNPVGLLSLQPGVVFTGIENDPRNGSVNGGRSDQANVTLDGVDVNAQQTADAFNSVVPVTIDSVQEFRVVTTNPNASMGRSSGGQVGLVTKRGTNEFSGSLYEFHRNTVFTANDFFNNSAGLERPKLLRNVFGGSLGGPIKKGRAFFFGTFEGRRDASGFTVVRSNIPTEALRSGTLVYEAAANDARAVPCPGNPNRRCGVLTPATLRLLDPLGVGANPAILQLFSAYPQGNDPSLSRDGGLSSIGLRFNAPQAVKRNAYIARFDLDVTGSGKHLVYWRGSLANNKEDIAPPDLPGQSPQLLLNNSKGYALAYTAVLSSTLANDFRLGFSRQGVETTGLIGPALTIRNYDFQSVNRRGVATKIPVYNIVDDLTQTRGTHTLQTGLNFRFIRNDRSSFTNSFPIYAIDSFQMSGNGFNLGNQLGSGAFATFPTPANAANFASAASYLLGILTQVRASLNFDKTGAPLPFGQAINREFAANEYELYVQDSWRARSNLTLSMGLRYSYFGVPYEKNGLQVQSTVNFGQYFDQRALNAAQGIPSNQSPLLTFDLAGPANGKPGYYGKDLNNFGPRLSFAYSPAFKSGLFGKFFGGPDASAIRGGYSLVYDRIGGSFIVDADISGAFGLVSGVRSQSNQFSFGFPGAAPPAPRFTGLGSLPAVGSLASLPTAGFPNTPTANFSGTGFGIDQGLRTPYSQSWNLSFSRQLPSKLTLEMAYVARVGHSLLSKYDIAAPLNLTDPASGTTYFAVFNQYYALKTSGGSLTGPIPYVENIFPGLANKFIPGTASQNFFSIVDAFGPSAIDLIWDLDLIDQVARFGPFSFMQQQFQSFPIWRSLASSSYHSFQLILRKRFSRGLQFDLNYTFSKSIDSASDLENSGRLGGQIPDAFNPRNALAVSSFDISHQLNANWVAEVPIGKGKRWLGGAPTWLDQVVGGWQLSGIFRYRTGFPLSVDNGFHFPVNFFLTGPATTSSAVNTEVNMSASGGPNLFANPQSALNSFTFTDAGSSGSRNVLRAPRFFTLDMGLSKSFMMPWSEKHHLQIRWEAFNLTNTPNFSSFSLSLDDPSSFGKIVGTTGDSSRRIMQVGLRYDF